MQFHGITLILILLGLPEDSSMTKSPQEDQVFSRVAQKHFQALSYPEESEMGVFFALAIPLDDPVSTKAVSVAFFFEANYKLPNGEEGDELEGDETREFGSNRTRRRSKSEFVTRKTIYRILEAKFESVGLPGRECLLRTICETSRESLHLDNGLVGDLFRILFAPSSSEDEDLSPDYVLAERGLRLDTLGMEGIRNIAETGKEEEDVVDCITVYPSCPISIYDYITDSYE